MMLLVMVRTMVMIMNGDDGVRDMYLTSRCSRAWNFLICPDLVGTDR